MTKRTSRKRKTEDDVDGDRKGRDTADMPPPLATAGEPKGGKKESLSPSSTSEKVGASGKDDNPSPNAVAISKLVTSGLWDKDPKVVEASLTEVANLSFGNNSAGPNRVTISLTGGLLAIVKAMTLHENDPEVQAAGGRALQNLALDQNNKGGIASAGGIEALVQAMRRFPDDSAVQMGGCGTFQVGTSLQIAHTRG